MRLFRLALAAEDSGRHREARKLYLQSAQSGPGRPEPLHNLGLMEWAGNNFEPALDYFRSALERDPKFVLSLTAMARIAVQLERKELARECVEKLRILKESGQEISVSV